MAGEEVRLGGEGWGRRGAGGCYAQCGVREGVVRRAEGCIPIPITQKVLLIQASKDHSKNTEHLPMVIKPTIRHVQRPQERPHVRVRPVDDRVAPLEARPVCVGRVEVPQVSAVRVRAPRADEDRGHGRVRGLVCSQRAAHALTAFCGRLHLRCGRRSCCWGRSWWFGVRWGGAVGGGLGEGGLCAV